MCRAENPARDYFVARKTRQVGPQHPDGRFQRKSLMRPAVLYRDHAVLQQLWSLCLTVPSGCV